MSDPFVTAMGVAASGMRAQGTRVRVVTENVANADTPGFRRKQVTFDELASDGVSTLDLGSKAASRLSKAASCHFRLTCMQPTSMLSTPFARRSRVRSIAALRCSSHAPSPAALIDQGQGVTTSPMRRPVSVNATAIRRPAGRSKARSAARIALVQSCPCCSGVGFAASVSASATATSAQRRPTSWRGATVISPASPS
jgi:hypothetical protein